MSICGYTFIGEVKDFDRDSYMAHLGWNAVRVNRYKIYTREGSSSYFLHDEQQDRMYEFIAADPAGLVSTEEYEHVLRTFEGWWNRE